MQSKIKKKTTKEMCIQFLKITKPANKVIIGKFPSNCQKSRGKIIGNRPFFLGLIAKK